MPKKQKIQPVKVAPEALVLQQLIQLFADKSFFMQKEVYFWEELQEIAEFLSKRGYSELQILRYFMFYIYADVNFLKLSEDISLSAKESLKVYINDGN